jgi:hypothetical protein
MNRMKTAAFAAGVCVAASSSGAQPFQASLEPPINGSMSGVSLNGQAGFYNPRPANSTDWMVFTYAGGPMGFEPNPSGSAQFTLGIGEGGDTRARAQIDYEFTPGKWRFGSDVAVGFSGTLPAENPIGSLSMEPWQVTEVVNLIPQWTDPNTADSWDMAVGYFDSGNQWVVETVPGSGFTNLEPLHWYHWWSEIDFDTSEIELVGITDLATGQTSTLEPTGWYLGGGPGGAPLPTGIRFVAGANQTPGNMVAFDNVEATPESLRITLSHSADPASILVGNSIACATPTPPTRTFATSFYRSFDLSQNPSIFGDFQVESVEIGVEVAVHPAGQQDVTVALYEDMNGGHPLVADLRLLASATTTIPDMQTSLVSIPVVGTVPEDATLVVEVATPDYSGQTQMAAMFIGSNDAGQSGPTYWRAAGCGFPQIIDVADPLVGGGGFPDMHLVMSVEGTVVETSCYADCDQVSGVGVLDVFDFLCFQDRFVSGDPYACNCDVTSGAGVCDVFDFLCFQDAFVSGCP